MRTPCSRTVRDDRLLMPPKDDNAALKGEDLKDAVDFMLSKSSLPNLEWKRPRACRMTISRVGLGRQAAPDEVV